MTFVIAVAIAIFISTIYVIVADDGLDDFWLASLVGTAMAAFVLAVGFCSVIAIRFFVPLPSDGGILERTQYASTVSVNDDDKYVLFFSDGTKSKVTRGQLDIRPLSSYKPHEDGTRFAEVEESSEPYDGESGAFPVETYCQWDWIMNVANVRYILYVPDGTVISVSSEEEDG